MAGAFHASAASAHQLAGAGTGSVVGVVRDATGTLMPDVDVTVSGRTLITPRKTISRADGEYHFAALPPGDYVLAFVSPGFATAGHEAHVGLGFTLTVNLTLGGAGQQGRRQRGAARYQAWPAQGQRG